MIVRETEDHLAKEREIATYLEARWDVALIKDKKFSRVDRRAYRFDDLVGFVEIKDRSKYSMAKLGSMGGFFISYFKWRGIWEAGFESSLPSVIAIRTRDGIYWHQLRGDHDGVGRGGRTDRGHRGDIEPVVYLLPHRFKLA